MGQIILIRHGQASFGAEDYDCLSALGVGQSERLGEWFAQCGQRVGCVATGPMQRHRQTAEACMARLSAIDVSAWQTFDGLAEYDHQDVLSRHRPDLTDGPAINAFLATSIDARRSFQRVFAEAIHRWVAGHHDSEYVESWSTFRRRVLDALEQLAARNTEGDTLVFTSGGPISVICQHLLEAPEAKATELSFVLANCSVTRLAVRSGRVSLASFNNFSHLETGLSDGANLVTYR